MNGIMEDIDSMVIVVNPSLYPANGEQQLNSSLMECDVTPHFSLAAEQAMPSTSAASPVSGSEDILTEDNWKKLTGKTGKNTTALPPLRANEKCYITKHFSGSESASRHLVTVVQQKYNLDTRRMEYFVHYDNFDRRHDEWVQREQLSVPEGDSLPDKNLVKNHQKQNTKEHMTMTRRQRRILNEINHVQTPLDEMKASEAAYEMEREKRTKVKDISKIQFGEYEIDTWYYSPFHKYVQEYSKVFFCEYCLRYMVKEVTYRQHLGECECRQPLGDEIYRHGTISIYEIDGALHAFYCQCLCLLAKLFLDHKVTVYDVSSFMFYVLCEVDRNGAHLVGYFSKEKFSFDRNNISCLLTMPQFQKMGYGKLLIQFSYELSRIERLPGGPERPLSDLGKVSYQSYWCWVLLNNIEQEKEKENISIDSLCQKNCMREYDVVAALTYMDLVKYVKGRSVFWYSDIRIKDLLSSDLNRAPRLQILRSAIRWVPLGERAGHACRFESHGHRSAPASKQ